MNRLRHIPRSRRGERGQTLVLVAVSLVTLLGFAALAIDVVTLYVARAETQRAADAAAITAAKAFVDSGVTTNPGDTTTQTLAQNLATQTLNALLAQNFVSGGSPTLAPGSPTFDFTTRPGNPTVTVTLQRTGLPTFFARIWGAGAQSVTATAIAEAYNPSNSQTQTGDLVPILPKCIKPLMIANKDPTTGAQLIDPVTGIVNNPSAVINEDFTLQSLCPIANCTTGSVPGRSKYIPVAVTGSTGNLCPSCSSGSGFDESISCCDVVVYACGGGSRNARMDVTVSNSSSRTQSALQCLIHASGNGMGAGQDQLISGTYPSAPMQITAGSNNPYINGTTVKSGDPISASSSIISIPIFDDSAVPPITGTGDVTIIGFLQAFVKDVPGGAIGDLDGTVLNVVGCGNSTGSSPAVSGGSSPIPVRLIRQ